MGFPWAIFQKKEKRLCLLSRRVTHAAPFFFFFCTFHFGLCLHCVYLVGSIENLLDIKRGAVDGAQCCVYTLDVYVMEQRPQKSVIYANSVERDE